MSNLDDLSARLAAIVAKTPGQQERLAEIMARVGDVEPMDLTAPAETLIAVPWTTPTTNENAFARTLELANMQDSVVCRECRQRPADNHGIAGWLCDGCATTGGEDGSMTEPCFRCGELKDPYVRFTGGGSVCRECAMFLPVGCENCRHHYSYHKGGAGVCCGNVERQLPGGVHYGPCGCSTFTPSTLAQLEERLRQDQAAINALTAAKAGGGENG